MAVTIKDAGINVQIVRETRSPSQRGFGAVGFVALVPTVTERIKLYTSAEAVSADYPAGTEPYNAALSFYSQSPVPTDFYVIQAPEGTPATPAVGTYTITGTAAGDGDVVLDIDGTQYSITPALGDDATLMGDTLAIQINGGTTHTAISVGGVITLTAITPGVGGNFVNFTDVTTDTGVTGTPVDPAGGADATLGESIQNTLDEAVLVNPDFYCVVLDKNYRGTPQNQLDCSAWTEANERLHFASANDPLIKDQFTDTDIASLMQADGYTRTYLQYSSYPDQYPEVGAFAIIATTSFRGTDTLKTLKFKDIVGITTENIGPSDLEAIRGKGCNILFTTAGIRMIDAGRTPAGSWIDEVHGADALAEQIRVNVFGLLARLSTKVPYTERGMAQLKYEVESALTQYVTNGYLASGVDDDGNYLEPYTISSGLVANAPIADKTARIAPDIEFTARLAGAIHNVLINGKLVL